MKKTLIDLFTSKKFLVAITAVVVWVGGRFGFDVDTAVLDRIFAAFLVYVGAQGAADIGKSAAKINSQPVELRDMVNPSSLALTTIGPAAALLLVLGLVGAGGAALTGCNKQQALAVLDAAWDCTKPDVAQGAAALEPLAAAAFAQAENPDAPGTYDTTKLKAALSAANLKSDLGSWLTCAAGSAALKLDASSPPVTVARTPAVAAPIAPNTAVAAFAELRAAQFPGVTIKTAHGAL